MHKTNKEFALSTALNLAKSNIETCEHWVDADAVTDFIENVYAFLVGEDKNEE